MNISIGIDIEEINRFENKTIEKDSNFLKKIFTDKELDYCFKSKNYAPHLCARFCAKEAAVKALTDLKITDVYYSDIEVLNHENGMPYIKIKKYPELELKVSMSHCKSYATASVLISR
jgi:phosphopantetheine--protein transferase-like protein